MTTTEETTAGTTNPGLSPSEGRPDSGAAAAFVGELYAAHGRTVLGLCRLLLRDPVEAEDATQQTYVSAQRALVGGAVPREPAAWLAAIARNECRARIRTRMREPLALPEIPSDVPDPLASAIRTADLDELWTALSALPRRQRKAFLLRELGGLSYEELGVALGVTRPAVESLLFRARQQLRVALMALNAALVPVSLREQLTRFLPLGSPTGGAPFAAKVAVVTAGLGLGAAGAVELPKHHRHHVRSQQPAVAPVSFQPAARTPALAVARSEEQQQSGHGGSSAKGRGRDEAEPETEHRGRDAPEPAEPEHEADPEAQLLEQEHSVPPPAAEEESHQADDGHGGSGDSGSGGRGDSGSDSGHSSGSGD